MRTVPNPFAVLVAAGAWCAMAATAVADVRIVVVPPWYWRRDVWAGCVAVGLVSGALVARAVSLNTSEMHGSAATSVQGAEIPSDSTA